MRGFPGENIEESIYGTNSDQDNAIISDDEITRCKFAEIPWASKSQYDRILRKPDSLEIDSTPKIIHQDRPLGYINGIDGEI